MTCGIPYDRAGVIAALVGKYQQDALTHGMNGIDFAMAVLNVKPDAKVVVVSGYMDPRDRERAKAAGVHECINKPSTLDEMRDMIAALLPNP